MKKDVGIAYLFLLLFGCLGIHKFYLERTGMGIFYLFTLGGFGIGVFLDIFTLAGQVRAYNADHAS